MPPDSASGTGSLGNGGRPGPGIGSGDWASFVTNKIESFVAIIRDKAVTPVVQIVRYAIFGLVAVTVGALLAVLFAVGLIRVFDAEVFHRRVWASYFLVAGIFSLVGLLCVWLRRPRS